MMILPHSRIKVLFLLTGGEGTESPLDYHQLSSQHSPADKTITVTSASWAAASTLHSSNHVVTRRNYESQVPGTLHTLPITACRGQWTLTSQAAPSTSHHSVSVSSQLLLPAAESASCLHLFCQWNMLHFCTLLSLSIFYLSPSVHC